MTLLAWPGTLSEWNDLTAAVERQCKARNRPRSEDSDPPFEGQQCRTASEDGPELRCAAHQMLADEKLLKSLIFVRRKYGNKLWPEEITPIPEVVT